MKFINCGKFTSREQWAHPEYTLDDTELIVVTEGSFGIYEGAGECRREFRLMPGTVLFIDPGKLYGGIESTHERVSFYWLHFHPDEPLSVKHLNLREPYPVTLLCRQILHYSAGGFEGEVCEALLRVLLAEIKAQSVGVEPERGLASRIVEWIRINSDRALEVADITARFGYNEDYISRLLKRKYGSGLKQFICEKRMDYLKRQLLETELTLTEISDAAGFADCKLFLKFFRYHEGITPTEFRKVFGIGHTNNR